MKKAVLCFLACAFACMLVACGKMKTVTTDSYLIENPGEKKPVYVQNGKVKRGEYVKVKEEKIANGAKFFLVEIEGVTTKGWLEEKVLKDGKLESVTVITDSPLYSRPNLKSEKAGQVAAGQVAFKIEEKDSFVLINYPGKEAYIEKANLGEGSMVVKTVTFPGLGKATVSATSQFSFGEGKELEFDPRNLFDGSLQTAWCEGKPDDGIGEYVQVTFPQTVQLTGIDIVNGWAKGEEYYKQNGRVAELKIVSNTDQEAVVTLTDENYDYQHSDISVGGTSFKFIINKVHKGKDPDTCISEIKLQGTSTAASGEGPSRD